MYTLSFQEFNQTSLEQRKMMEGTLVKDSKSKLYTITKQGSLIKLPENTFSSKSKAKKET
jgi:hypothetical protein